MKKTPWAAILRDGFVIQPSVDRTVVDGRRAISRLVFLLLLPLTWLNGCDSPVETIQATPEVVRPSTELAITQFCSGCHVFPPPSSFPRARWRHEVEQGFRIYRDSRRNDLVPTDVEATVAWFESFAPEKYQFESDDVPEESRKRFERIEVPQQQKPPLRKVAHLRSLGSGKILLSELYSGLVCIVDLADESVDVDLLAQVADPVHAEPADLDGDGRVDYVVADIGTLNPAEQRFGTLWWVRQTRSSNTEGADPSAWEVVPLETGYSRLCDARPLDYDQDGDQDLVIAEFGFRFEGSIRLLTNVGLVEGVPKFESAVVDDRNGAIHVPVVDLNADGKDDFLTLVSQEHEAIEAHLNLGGGKFERKVVFQAGDPAYASSGIEPVDIDGDGDLDVLLTNGDTFDDHTAKPFHSVQWLENKGSFPFTHHHLTSMPGVYRAVAGDIDLDGDMDIAAVSLVSKPDSEDDSKVDRQGQESFDGVIWLEQTERGEFVRHRILAQQCHWATCELIDVDQDGDLDLVLGKFFKGDDPNHPIVYYRNTTAE